MSDPLVDRLRAAGCVFAEDEARLLRAEAAAGRALEPLVARRLAGEPLEVVLGWVDFCGVRVRLVPGVFVPRRRTALLVREALRLSGAAPVVVDVCCGAGALGAAVLAARPLAQVHATDLDPVATACAALNLPPGRVRTGDLLDALPEMLRGRVDVVVANTPYVPSARVGLMPREAREHEPRHALDGGPDGLDLHRRLAADAPGWLAPGGHLLVETSADQLAGTLEALGAAGLRAHAVTDDDLGAVVVVGRRR